MRLFDYMAKIVQESVNHYQTDFDHDKDILLKKRNENETFYWFTRECGTELFREKDLLAKDTYPNIAFKFQFESNNIKRAFRIKVSKVGRKHVYGSMENINPEKLYHWVKQNEADYSGVKVQVWIGKKTLQLEYNTKEIEDAGGLISLINHEYGDVDDMSVLEYKPK